MPRSVAQAVGVGPTGTNQVWCSKDWISAFAAFALRMV